MKTNRNRASRVFHEGVEKSFVKCLQSVEGRCQPVSCINAHFSLSTPNLSKMKRYSESLTKYSYLSSRNKNPHKKFGKTSNCVISNNFKKSPIFLAKSLDLLAFSLQTCKYTKIS